MFPFSPKAASTVNIDVSASSQSILIDETPGIRQVLITNNGTATVWINFGGSGVTASLTTGIPIAAGSAGVFTTRISDGPTYFAAIAAGATGKIYATPGQGL